MANDESQPPPPARCRRTALRLVHSAPPPGTMFGAGTREPPFLLTPAEDFFAHLEGAMEPRVMDPTEMVAHIEAFESLTALANEERQPTVEGDVDWQEVAGLSDWSFGSAKECLAAITPPYRDDDFDLEPLWDWIYERLDTTIAALDDAQREGLVSFVIDPQHASLAADHPVVQRQPDFVAAIRRMDLDRRRVTAKTVLGRLYRPYLFWGDVQPKAVFENCIGPPFRVPKHQTMDEAYPGLFKGRQELWCFFEPNDTGTPGREECFIYRYSAVWLDVGSTGVGTLVASASGYYIPLFMNGCYLGDAAGVVCDSHSELLARAWYAVEHQFFPTEGIATQEQFRELVEGEGAMPAIAVTWLYVAKPFRHHRLADVFLDNMADLLRSGDGCNYLNAEGNHRPPFPEAEEDADDSYFERIYGTPGPGQSPIRLFLIPITGTPMPEDPEFKAFMELEADGRLGASDAEQEEIEARWEERRFHLARYFRDLHPADANDYFVRPFTP